MPASKMTEPSEATERRKRCPDPRSSTSQIVSEDRILQGPAGASPPAQGPGRDLEHVLPRMPGTSLKIPPAIICESLFWSRRAPSRRYPLADYEALERVGETSPLSEFG